MAATAQLSRLSPEFPEFHLAQGIVHEGGALVERIHQPIGTGQVDCYPLGELEQLKIYKLKPCGPASEKRLRQRLPCLGLRMRRRGGAKSPTPTPTKTAIRCVRKHILNGLIPSGTSSGESSRNGKTPRGFALGAFG